ncbi:MAG: Hsp20/alpha crystallin family protein [Thermodesulfobacteriota bacterium]
MRSLIPWTRKETEPISETVLSDLRREFDTLFDRFFEPQWPDWGRAEGRRFVPAFDVSETDEELLVKGDIPGVAPNDVNVSVAGNVLTVRGERKEEREEKTESVHRIERSFGSFSRSFTLPTHVDVDNIKATYKNGTLELRLPKAERSKRKTIKVDVA